MYVKLKIKESHTLKKNLLKISFIIFLNPSKTKKTLSEIKIYIFIIY